MLTCPEDLLKLDPSTLLSTWDMLKKQKDFYTVMEMEARKLLSSKLFDDSLPEGTHSVSVGVGATLKFKKAYNYRVSKDLDAIHAVRTRLSSEASATGSHYTFQSIFEDTVKFSESAYKKAMNSKYADKIAEILAEVVTQSEASPTLELIIKS